MRLTTRLTFTTLGVAAVAASAVAGSSFGEGSGVKAYPAVPNAIGAYAAFALPDADLKYAPEGAIVRDLGPSATGGNAYLYLAGDSLCLTVLKGEFIDAGGDGCTTARGDEAHAPISITSRTQAGSSDIAITGVARKGVVSVTITGAGKPATLKPDAYGVFNAQFTQVTDFEFASFRFTWSDGTVTTV